MAVKLSLGQASQTFQCKYKDIKNKKSKENKVYVGLGSFTIYNVQTEKTMFEFANGTGQIASPVYNANSLVQQAAKDVTMSIRLFACMLVTLFLSESSVYSSVYMDRAVYTVQCKKYSVHSAV